MMNLSRRLERLEQAANHKRPKLAGPQNDKEWGRLFELASTVEPWASSPGYAEAVGRFLATLEGENQWIIDHCFGEIIEAYLRAQDGKRVWTQGELEELQRWFLEGGEAQIRARMSPKDWFLPLPNGDRLELTNVRCSLLSEWGCGRVMLNSSVSRHLEQLVAARAMLESEGIVPPSGG